MAKKKIDLRFNDYREAIVEMGNAIDKCELSNRAMAILIADSCSVTMGQALEVLEALPRLRKRYVKKRCLNNVMVK